MKVGEGESLLRERRVQFEEKKKIPRKSMIIRLAYFGNVCHDLRKIVVEGHFVS